MSDAAISAGLLPARLPTESRFVLRLLRPGYVHIYIPAPPAGTKNWLVYRVTEQADLVPWTSDLFSQPAASIACSRTGHNSSGLKLLNLPQAHKIEVLWIAYSANLWNETLREKNKGDQSVMQKIVLHGEAANSFAPTASNLKSKILECALHSLSNGKSADHDFAFNSLANEVEQLAANLSRAAACHPKTKGKEVAIVLRDAVGIAAELNTLRLRRDELRKDELQKPENAHPLNSSNALMGLKKTMMDAEELDSFEQVSPLRTKEKFDSQTWPPGADWQALTPADRHALTERASGSILLKPYKDMFARPDMGRVIYSDHDERAAAWARQKVEASWSKLARHYDEEARATWLKDFTERIYKQHYAPLAKFEEDWRASADDVKTVEYFEKHFDPKDPNDPLKPHRPGVVFAQENHYINTPAPITNGAVLDKYLTLLDKPITDPSATVLRALVGNQESVIHTIHVQLTGDGGADGMRDKSYDMVKGLNDFKPTAAALKKYSWMGDGIAMFSVGQLAAMSGAVLSAAARHPEVQASTTRALGKLQQLWCVQQVLETATQGAVHGGAPKIPVLLTMKVDVDEALAVLRARGRQAVEMSKTRIKKHRATNTKIQLTLLTDTDALRTCSGNAHALTTDAGNGQVKLGTSATSAVTASAAGSAVILTEQQFLRLYERQSTLGTKAVNAVRTALSGAGARDVRAIAMTLEGRLALGSMIVQGIGLVNGLNALSNAKAANQVRDAWYGIYDSTAGLAGGLLQTYAVVTNVRLVLKGGEAAAAASAGLAGLRFAANVAGAVGGMINAYALWAKRDDAKELGNRQARDLFLLSSYAFVATVGTSAASAVGVAADMLVARGAGGALVRTIAARVGAQGVLATVGGTALTLSGIGIILLGAGVALQIGAIALTPTPVQRWIGRSYFGREPGILFDGKRDDMFCRGDWRSEFDALMAVLKDAAPQQSTDVQVKVVQPAASL